MAPCVATALQAARLLLEGGADPALADSDGDTPLMAAAGTGQIQLVRLLLKKGAVHTVDATTPAEGIRRIASTGGTYGSPHPLRRRQFLFPLDFSVKLYFSRAVCRMMTPSSMPWPLTADPETP